MMKKSKWLPPYKKNGSTNFPQRKASGVYLIKKKEKIVYVGYSGSDVYTTMYRHFQEWNDRTRQRVTFIDDVSPDIKVRVVYCSKAKAIILERALILLHSPKLNADKMESFEMNMPETNALMEYEEETYTAPF